MSKEELITRIRRIKGQVEGIERMIANRRSCLEIIQQISAAKSALAKTASQMLTEEFCQIDKKKKPKEFEQIVEQLVKGV